MKISTRFLTITLILFVCCPTWAQKEKEPIMTLVTSLTTTGASQLIFEPSGELEVSFWNQEFLQLNIQIDSTNLRREQLKTMIPLGVFRPETSLEGKCLVLTMPGIQKSTLFNGKEITWKIHYTLNLPHSVEVIRKGIEIK